MEMRVETQSAFLRQKGDLAAAEPLARQAVAMFERTTGKDTTRSQAEARRTLDFCQKAVTGPRTESPSP